MIPNGRRGGSATGLVGYLAGKGNKNEHQHPRVIGGDQELLMLLPDQGRDLSRRDVRVALARALEAPRRQTGVDVRLKNKTTGRYEHKHIAHWSLTLAPEDMRQPLSDAQWNWVAERFVEKMGLTGCRYVVVRHGDTVTGLGHAHIALNLVRPDGTRASTVRDWPRAQRACAQIASDLGLAMPHKQSRHLNTEQRGRALIHQPAETGIRHELRQRVDTALSEATDAEMLAGALHRHGVRWHNTNRDGRKGFSFSYKDRPDIWLSGGEIDASPRQVGQRLKNNASHARQEQQHQELEAQQCQEHQLQQRIANDPALADFLAAQRLVNLGNPNPPATSPLTPAEAEPERSHPDQTRGTDPDNGPDRS
jgi:Relaxase/Mobilisation nuclease domain